MKGKASKLTRVTILRMPATVLLLILLKTTALTAQVNGATGLDSVFISLQLNNASISQALEVIGQRSGFGVIFKDADVMTVARIDYKTPRVSVAGAVSEVLKSTPLSYRTFRNNIIIYKRAAPKKISANGKLIGDISDEATGEMLVGASVRIIGTSFGNICDEKGHYAITGIPEGTYEIAFSFIGYENVIIRDVKISGDQQTTLSYKLKSSGTTLQDIEVIGDRVLSGNVIETNESALMKEIKNSLLIITGISAQQISRSVDQDAGEVARRLPGVSVQNNFVNVRGMHERYNITYLNGMVAPSSESDRRAFSYDLLPSNMIDKMTVYRSPAPELLADWAGGTIKIETKNTSIARQVEVNFSTWYRPGSNGEQYYTYEGGKKDWLGKDDGTRSLPKGFPGLGEIPAGGIGDPGYSRTDPNGFKGVEMTPENIAANAQWSKKLYNKWNLKKEKSGLDYRAGVNYYDAWRFKNVRVSNLTSINTTQAIQLIDQDFIPQRITTKDGTVSDTKAFRDTISRTTARWGILQNLTIGISPRHTIELKGLYNVLGIDETLVREGNENTLDFSGYVRNIIYTYRTRSIGLAQIATSHRWGDQDKNQLRWSFGYSNSKEDVPAQRGFYNPHPPFDNLTASNRGSVNNALYYIGTNENNFTYTADFEKKVIDEWTLKLGGFHESKRKDMNSRMIKISLGNTNFFVVDGDSITETNYDKIFNPEIFREDGLGAYIFDNDFLSGQYHINGRIYAGYAALNIPLVNKRFNIYGGVRYEGQDLLLQIPDSEYLALIGRSATLIDRYKSYWLPSINLSWKFSDKIVARAAYGKTLNRPNYRELMPFALLDPRLDNLTIGSDSLVDAKIHNLDFRLEFYPGDGEFISAGFFYKLLQDAIEPYAQRFGQSDRIYFDNTDRATVRGIEFELRKSLSFIPWEFARNFSIIANVAFLQSEVTFTDGLIPNTDGQFLGDNRDAVRPLEGTAKYVVNSGLYYENDAWGTRLSFLYNITGQRLVYAPTSVWPATYERPRSVLDMTLKQRITKYLDMRFAIQDIFNQPRRLYRDYDRNQRYTPNLKNKLPYQDWIFQEYKPGSYFMVGINLTF